MCIYEFTFKRLFIEITKKKKTKLMYDQSMYLATASAGLLTLNGYLLSFFSYAESSACMHTLSYAKLELQWNSGHHLQQLVLFPAAELALASNPPSFTIVNWDFSRDSASLHLSAATPRWCTAKALNLPNAAQGPHQFNWSFWAACVT